MGAWRAASLEGLDDDHASPAAWARMRERPRFIGIGSGCIAGLGLRSRRIEQLPCPRDVLDMLAAGEQAVVADAMETTRHVDQEAADELVGGERHELLSFAALGAIILPLGWPAGYPTPAVQRDAPAWHDHMDVRMMGERRTQVCSTEMTPIRAPRCSGSAAMVISVSAEALNRMS